jgi:hypothetical protein
VHTAEPMWERACSRKRQYSYLILNGQAVLIARSLSSERSTSINPNSLIR